MGSDQVQRGQQMAIAIFILLTERLASFEGDAPVPCAPKQAEELRGQLFEPGKNPVQFRRAELFQAADDRDIPPQVLKTVVADGNSEILADDVRSEEHT